MGTKVDLPVIFDIVDRDIRVTLYPTGHLAVGVDEMMEEYGFEQTPPELGFEVRKYLGENWAAKVLSEDDGKRISDEVACIVRAWIVKSEGK